MKDKFLDGRSFCITGPLNSYTRDDYEIWITERGGIFHKSVTKKTDYLVTNLDSNTRKRQMAEKYGTVIIDEEKLVKLRKTILLEVLDEEL